MKSIAFFNNKGGVGKTTLLCNMAAYLAIKRQLRVLVIDADPQCNATTYILNDSVIEKTYVMESPTTIQRIIDPVAEGGGFIAKSDIPIHHSVSFGIDVIMGDTLLAMSEDLLSGDWITGKSGGARGLNTTLLFYDLIMKLESNYDYIFFDVGPSLGAINRSILLACDYFLMPMSSDIFSVKAINNIAKSLISWKEDLQKGVDAYALNYGKNLPVLRENGVDVKFIGYVVQQYTAKSVNGRKRPVKAFEEIINRAPQQIIDLFSPFYNPALSQMLKIGEIANFNSLIPLSQLAHKPVFQLEGTDRVVGAHFTKVKEFCSIMEQMVNRLMDNLNVYDNVAE